MAKQVGGLEQLLIQELQDLFDAEKQLVRALPKMAKSATDEGLEAALRDHLEVTRGQVQRIEQVFETMDMRARSRPCKGMKGIVEEGQEVMEEDREESILDSALAGSARKVEHYEIAGYESARGLARQLGMREAAQLLEETLREEIEADRQLAQISKRLVKESSSRLGRESGQSAGTGGGQQRSSSGRASARGGASRSSSSASSSSASSSRGGARGRQTGSASSRGGSRSASARNPKGSQRNAGGSAHPLTDHDQIRSWAEERGATPSCVRRTGGRGDIGMIRLDFPGYTGADSLEPISWDDWFRKFDQSGLALLVQDTLGSGAKSNFNKLVKRETAEERPRARAAR